MTTVYLHIGVGKTGTTAIQKVLSSCSMELLKNNIQYVQSGGGGAGVGHQNFAKSFITNPPSYMIRSDSKNSRAAIQEEILSSPQKIFLLSSENFVLADPFNVKEFFDSIPKEIFYKVVLFVRSQDELAESEYNQMIKVRNERRSFLEYAEEEFYGDFYSLAERWSNVFGVGNITCRVFDARKNSAVEDFVGCLPISKENILKACRNQHETRNSSLGHIALTVKRMINRLPSTDLEPKHFQIPQEVADFLGVYDVSSVCMNSQQAESFRSKYAKSNERFSEVYLGKKQSNIGGLRFTSAERDELYNQSRLIDGIL